MVAIPEKLYGIFGYPLGHSLSPLLHNFGFQEHAIPAVYMAFPVAPEDLGRAMAGVRALPVAGASVTIPHKVAVMEFLDGASDRARAVGAVNTLFWEDGRLLGENTDVAGVLRPLQATGKLFHSAMVLGAGGAARACLAALRELGVPEVAVANRSRAKAEALAADFGARAVDWEARARGAELYLNTTPLGMLGAMLEETPLPQKSLGPESTVFDLVYNPLETRLVREARAAGSPVILGLEMFLHQGLEQFRIWTGEDLDADEARRVLLAGLEG